MKNFTHNIISFQNIPASPKREMILFRLGYKKNITVLSEENMRMLEECIFLGGSLCKPAGVYMRIPVAERNERMITLENGLSFDSIKLSVMLKNSSSVVLMASTVGKEVTEKIKAEVKDGNAAEGLILDSVASQTADAAIDWICQHLNQVLIREGKKLTKHRFSPGYGDLSLSYQKDIFNALQLNKLNMQITEKFMLIPEKSVIAIAGIEEGSK